MKDKAKKVDLYVDRQDSQPVGSLEIISVNGVRVALERGKTHKVDEAIANEYRYRRRLREGAAKFQQEEKNRMASKAAASGASGA